jgi:hypothetical protein
MGKAAWTNRWPEDREYAFVLREIGQVLKDALDGPNQLALIWLFTPAPQVALARMLDMSEDATLEATRVVIRKVRELIAEGRAGEVRRLLSYRRKKELREVFG